uniref:Uncharacterized protein n=1 Tax=Arundo donax TaxID=35708 RepID=A0A0A9F9N4_ARUDO
MLSDSFLIELAPQRFKKTCNFVQFVVFCYKLRNETLHFPQHNYGFVVCMALALLWLLMLVLHS